MKSFSNVSRPVIIDVRDNGGGYLADMQEILAP